MWGGNKNSNKHGRVHKFLKFVGGLLYGYTTKWDKRKGKKILRGYNLVWFVNSTPVRAVIILFLILVIIAIAMSNGISSAIETLLVISCFFYNGLMFFGVYQRSVRNRYSAMGAIAFTLLWTFFVLYAIVSEVTPIIQLFTIVFVGTIVLRTGMLRVPVGYSAVLRIRGTDTFELLKDGVHCYTPYLFSPVRMKWRYTSYDTIDKRSDRSTPVELVKVQTSHATVESGQITCTTKDNQIVNFRCNATFNVIDLSMFCVPKHMRITDCSPTYRNLRPEDFNPPNIVQKELSVVLEKQCKGLTLTDALRGNYKTLLTNVLEGLNTSMFPLKVFVEEVVIDSADVVSAYVGGWDRSAMMPQHMEHFVAPPVQQPIAQPRTLLSMMDIARAMKLLNVSAKEIVDMAAQGVDMTEKKEEQKKEQ